jgi:hypothetical protein
MAGSESESEFRVTDRRRHVGATEPPVPDASPATGEEPERRTPAREPSGGARPAASGERTLEGLFMMLASSAVVGLGESADPTTGQVRKDLSAASSAIDLLVLLREKTEGNRIARETRILEELIYDLQLRYVAAMKPRL